MEASFKISKRLILVAALSFSPVFAYAASECEITTHRTACPGKEQEVLKPYGDKNPTVEIQAAATAESCKSLAEQSVKIVRKGTLKVKTVSAKFNKDAKRVFEGSDTSECS